MYQVIIALDKSRDKSYYYSYVAADGNIECDELPPYADPYKARACYWDSNNKKWVYDADKYAALVQAQQAAVAAEEQAQKEAAAVPTNEELAEAVLELANVIADIVETLTASGMMGGDA